MRPYLTIVNLILVAAIAYFGVHAVYRLAALPLETTVHSRGTPVAAPGGQDPAADRPDRSYRDISDRNLFNTSPQAAPRPGAVDLDNLALTGLKLKLWGTVAGGEAYAYAVIEDEGEKRQRLYRPGDTVRGADIRLILREKVVLTVNGRDEILSMEKPLKKGAARPSVPAEAASTNRRRITLQGSQITAALGDLHALGQQATIRPHFNQGRRDGFLLVKVQPRSMFSQMGLKTGDIIKSVNGQTITSVGQALNIYQNLTPGSEVDVKVSRRGTDQTLSFAIE